jgi:hypothetical protein
LSEKDLDLHVDLGTNVKCDVEGVKKIKFKLESRRSLEMADVLYVPELKKIFLLVATMDDRGTPSLMRVVRFLFIERI